MTVRTHPGRWRRCVIIVVVLVAAIFGTVHLLLRSDLPRQRIILGLSQSTGLHIDANKLEIGWLGSSVVQDVTVRLPLAEQPLLVIPTIRLDHFNLLRMAWARSAGLTSIELKRPVIKLHVADDGRWNIMQAVQLMKASLPSGSSSASPLPRLLVDDATVSITQPGRSQIVLNRIRFVGQPDAQLTWSMSLETGHGLAARGRVACGGTWWHTIDLTLEPAAALVTDLLPAAPTPVIIDGRWEGEVVDGQVKGQMQLTQLQIGRWRCSGTTGLELAAGRVALHPDHLELAAKVPLVLNGGSIALDDQHIIFDQLTASYDHVQAQLTADLNHRTRTGSGSLRWLGHARDPTIKHDGQVQLSVNWPEVGRKTVKATLSSQGTMPNGHWTAQVTATGEGTGPERLELRISTPELLWRDQKNVTRFDGLTVRLRRLGAVCYLDEVILPDAESSQIEGKIDLDTRAWQMQAQIKRWSMPLLRLTRLPVDLTCHAHGQLPPSIDKWRHGTVEAANVSTIIAETQATIDGRYQPHDPNPLSVQLAIDHNLSSTDRFQGAGHLHGQTQISGHLQPLRLTAKGYITGRKLSWADRELDDFRVRFHSELDDERLAVNTDPFEMLDGNLRFKCHMERESATVDLDIEADAIELRRLTELLGWPWDAEGRLRVSAHAHVPLAEPLEAEVDGGWRLTQLRGGLTDSAEGKIQMDGGAVHLDDIVLRKGAGQISGSLRFDLKDRRRLKLLAKAQQWPLMRTKAPASGAPDGVPPLEMQLDGEFDLFVDLAASKPMAAGTVALVLPLSRAGQSLGQVVLGGQLEGRVFKINSIGGELLGAQLGGQGIVAVDNVLASHGTVTMRRLNLSQLGEQIETLRPAQGFADIQLSFEPSKSSGAKVQLTVFADEAQLRHVQFTEATLAGRISGHRDFEVEQLNMQAAGGKLAFWLKASDHQGQTYGHSKLTFDGLDARQLSRTIHGEKEPMVGRIRGKISAVGYMVAPHRLVGEGQLHLSDSNLASLGVISALLEALSASPQTAQGQGEIGFRLDGRRLFIDRFYYFNRHLDARGAFAILDIWQGGQSPVEGLAAATLRPLKDSEIALLDKIDTALYALQKDVIAIRVDGSLSDTKYHHAPLESVDSAVKALLTTNGDTR